MDVRERRLRQIARRLVATRRLEAQLEAERDGLLRELAVERGHGGMTQLAEASGLTKGRISQIVKAPKNGKEVAA
jgi:DNA-binding MarR family transcriptional regulator